MATPREWEPLFLATLADVPNVSEACRMAGISRKAAYLYRAQDGRFREAWDDALETSTDSLVGEAYRRARHGTENPVYQGGELVGHKREFSDLLAIFLLKCHRREVYGDRSKAEITHQGPDGGPIRFDPTKCTDDELRAIIERAGRGDPGTEATGEAPAL
jgi:hypothetical protein